MNIGVDAGCLGIKDERLKVGVYIFAKELLIQLGKRDKKNNYFLYSFYPIEKFLVKQFGKNFKNVIVRPQRGWMQIWLPIKLIVDKVDIFLALSQAIPRYLPSNIKTVGFVYDIEFERYKEFYYDSYKKLHNNTRHLMSKADRLIAISQKVKNDIALSYKLPKEKISIVYPGVRKLQTSLGKKVVSYGKYFLSVGSLKRGKNVSATIRAFSLFCITSKDDYSLLIVGGDKWIDYEIKTIFDHLNSKVKKKIIFMGFVDDSRLSALYKNAAAIISPSYCEGFGLPVVEAMSIGCPVIASDRGSLPEIIGDAGIIVDPDNIKIISEKMKLICENKDLRVKLISKGIKRATLYSWERCGDDTLRIIRQLTEKNE